MGGYAPPSPNGGSLLALPGAMNDYEPVIVLGKKTNLVCLRDERLSFRHRGGTIEDTPFLKTLALFRHSIVLRGSRRVFNWVPIMPRDASLSDKDYHFFQAGSLQRDRFLNLVRPNQIVIVITFPIDLTPKPN